MKNISIYLIGLVILASLVFSCKNEKSLQQFIVTQQEKADVISVDIPVSLLALKEELQDEDDIETLKSVKKANILAYQIKDSSKARYQADKKHLKEILKGDKYAELVRLGKGNNGAKIYMVGDDQAIDELIVFANDDALGWLVLRVLGDDMKPEKIMQLMQKVDLENSNFDLSEIKDVLTKKGDLFQ